MKRIFALLLSVLLALTFVGCGKQEEKIIDGTAGASDIEVDLTTLSSTMVYSEVNDMMTTPQKYMGKKIKMRGAFSVYQGDTQNYFACIIADATACCQQGIEFSLKDERKYPEEYPELGTEITVEGTFTTYKEGDQMYCQLADAVIV